MDESAVPLDEMLINSLVKLAGGQKKGTTFPSHLPLDDLRTRRTAENHARQSRNPIAAPLSTPDSDRLHTIPDSVSHEKQTQGCGVGGAVTPT